MSYPYTTQDRLAEPHAYMYTAFQGPTLLRDYFADRERALRTWHARRQDAHPDAALVERAARPRHPRPPVAPPCRFDPAARTDTLALLLDLAGAAVDGLDEVRAHWLERLVQRFEVTKKLYRAYEPGFRKGADGFDSGRLYWLFALVLLLRYRETGDLRCLNCLLKAGDLLASLRDESVLAEIPAAGAALVLAAETACVKHLVEEKGIRLDA
jgi:hypothetical protein